METFSLPIPAVVGRDVIVVPFVDQAGCHAVGVRIGTDFFFFSRVDFGTVQRICAEAGRVVCFGRRELEHLGIVRDTIYDISLIYGGEKKLVQLIREHCGEHEQDGLLRQERRLETHARVAKHAGIDLDRYSFLSLVPSGFVEKLLRLRAAGITRLFQLATWTFDLGEYERDTWPFARALRQIEKNGIRVDRVYAEKLLKKDVPEHEAKFLRTMVDACPGYVYSFFNPCGGKTGRIRIEAGFNCMGIPHGPVRRGIVSRHSEGEIVVFDYNAIDYRCIISSVPGSDGERLRGLYEGCDDFHLRTSALALDGPLDDFRRNIVKQVSYMHIYGGSEETLAEKTGLSMEKTRALRERLDRILGPIGGFRRSLAAQARSDGFVMIPAGKKIPVAVDDHDGKIIGLYAQSFSSYVFQKALVAVQDWLGYNWDRESKIIFTVHDELVLDLHPILDSKLPMIIKDLMEHAVDPFVFRVNVKREKTYGDATDGPAL